MTQTRADAREQTDREQTDRDDAVERARDRVRAMTSRLPAPVRLVVVSVIGVTLVLAGLAMLVLPGPGLLTLFLGFAVLAAEFTIAYRVLRTSHAAAVTTWPGVRRPRGCGRRG